MLLLSGMAAGVLSLQADENADQKDMKSRPYPATNCLVSGEKLDSMGKPVILVVDGQELKFCCKNCVDDYNKDKTGYLKKLAKTEADAKPYALKICVVSGEKFEHGKPYVFAFEGQQVKLCCPDCLADFKKEPARYLKTINEAQKIEDKKSRP